MSEVISMTLAEGVLNMSSSPHVEQSAPGAYYVELTIKPKHLLSALGTAAALADQEYLWVITNPIFILP